MQNKTIKIFLILVLCLSFSVAKAEEGHDEHEGFEVSEKAIKNYGITLYKLPDVKNFVLPRTAMINAQDEFFIYKKEGNTFEQIEIHPDFVDDHQVRFENPEILPGDEIAVTGTKFLRVIFLDKEGGEVGHAH